MGSGVKAKPNKTHIDVETLASLYNYPISKRQWGMRITVYGDGANDGTYYLKYNENSTSIADNDNWIDFDSIYASGSGSWISSLNSGNASAIQNTVTSDISAQTEAKTFTGIDWNITNGNANGELNFLKFKKDLASVFRVSIEGHIYFKNGLSGAKYITGGSPSDNNLVFGVSGVNVWEMSGGSIRGASGLNCQIKRNSSSSTSPIFIPTQVSLSTGLGGAAGELDLIISGSSAINIDSLGASTFYNYQKLTEVTAPIDTPSAGTMYFYADSADSRPKLKNDAGTIFNLGSTGANNEFEKSDGSGGRSASDLFFNGNTLTLGSSGAGANRLITPSGSAANIGLIFYTKGAGDTLINGNNVLLSGSNTTTIASASSNTNVVFGDNQLELQPFANNTYTILTKSGDDSTSPGTDLLIQTGDASETIINGDGGDFTINLGIGNGTGSKGNFILNNIPTSPVGLPFGAVWNNAGVLNII